MTALPKTRRDVLAGLDYLQEAAPPPFHLSGPARVAADQLFDRLRAASFEKKTTPAARKAVVDGAAKLRTLLLRDEPLGPGTYLATLFELATLVGDGALDR